MWTRVGHTSVFMHRDNWTDGQTDKTKCEYVALGRAEAKKCWRQGWVSTQSEGVSWVNFTETEREERMEGEGLEVCTDWGSYHFMLGYVLYEMCVYVCVFAKVYGLKMEDRLSCPNMEPLMRHWSLVGGLVRERLMSEWVYVQVYEEGVREFVHVEDVFRQTKKNQGHDLTQITNAIHTASWTR